MHCRFRNKEHTRPASLCKACHAAWMRKGRVIHSRLTPAQRLKANARAYANVYKRRGKLVQKPCEKCGDARSHMHHDDYHKPLIVRWLCRPCYLAIHV